MYIYRAYMQNLHILVVPYVVYSIETHDGFFVNASLISDVLLYSLYVLTECVSNIIVFEYI